MAEVILKDLIEKKGLEVEVESAGILTIDGLPASENAIKVVKDRELDLSYFESKLINEELINSSDLILTMTESHKLNLLNAFKSEKVYTLSEYIGEVGDVVDPYGGNIEIYRFSASDLEGKLEKLVQKLSETDI